MYKTNKRELNLKQKALIVLTMLSIVPLISLGVISTMTTSHILKKNLLNITDQSIENLSLYISRELQSYLSLAFYSSHNDRISTILTAPKLEPDSSFYMLRGEIYKNDLVRQVSYPYHYLVISETGIVYNSFTYSNTSRYQELINAPWFQGIESSYTRNLRIISGNNYLSQAGGDQIYIVGKIMHNLEYAGVILIGVDKYFFSKLLSNASIRKGSNLYIFNSNGQALIDAEGNSIPSNQLPLGFIRQFARLDQKPDTFEINRKTFLINSKPLSLRDTNEQFFTIMITPMSSILKDLNIVIYITIMLIIICVIAMIVLSIIVNRTILNPIISLNHLTMEVSKGNLNIKAPENRKDEIGQLGMGFNHMTKSIKEYIDSVEEKEQTKRKLEISVLQSQINPHFVRNTLNIIRWMAEMKKARGISNAVVSFSKLLDYNFVETAPLIMVKEELNYLREYIYLQKLRYQNKFEYIEEVPKELYDCKILKFSFQPIIENCIVHGFKGKKGISTITLTGRIDTSSLIFTISDNGVGIDPDTLNNILKEDLENGKQSMDGYALHNIRKRIKLNFGESFDISIQSKKGKGTVVTVLFPLIREQG